MRRASTGTKCILFCCVYLFVFTLMFVVLKVNDVSMKDATHHVAVSALIANVPQIKLLVRHDRPPQGLQVHKFCFR